MFIERMLVNLSADKQGFPVTLPLEPAMPVTPPWAPVDRFPRGALLFFGLVTLTVSAMPPILINA
jgi:hypothetical protein